MTSTAKPARQNFRQRRPTIVGVLALVGGFLLPAICTAAIPVAPAGVSATDGTYPDNVRVTGNAVPGASIYEVWRHTANTSSSATRIAHGVTALSCDDTAAVGRIFSDHVWPDCGDPRGVV